MSEAPPTDPPDATSRTGQPATTKRRPMQPSDLCRLRSVSDVALHPDGGSAVYQVSWPDATSDSNRSQLYSIGVDGSDRRQLTFGHRDQAATFSPDGTRLAFIRSQPGQPATIQVMEWPVGEIVEVAGFADGAGWVGWLDDQRLVVTAAKRPSRQQDMNDDDIARLPRIITRLDYRFDGRGYINDRPQQIYALSAEADATPQEIGADGVDHGEVAIAPDGRGVAATAATDDGADMTGANHIWLYLIDEYSIEEDSIDEDRAGADRADEGRPPVRLTEVGGHWESLTWKRDGTLLATGVLDNSETRFAKAHTVAVIGPDQAPKVQPVGDHDHHLVPSALSGRAMVDVDGGILLPGIRFGRIAIDRYEPSTGGRTVIHEGPHQVHAFDASPDESIILAAITTTERPAELWRVDGADATKLVSLNDGLLAELELASTEVVTVQSEPGVDVQAFVIRPPAVGPDCGDPAPGLVYVHGGPMFQYGLGFFDEFQMAAACGYVVIAGNPRGSAGYGERWAQSIIGDLGNRDWLDVSALADHLSALAEVDPERIGIGGGSYGGFMTGWALSHDERFKAGLIERAVTSWNSFYGTSDIGPWFTRRTIGATVETDPDEVTRQSPLHHAADITAPTLIVHSEHDWRCPIEQGEQLFAALRRGGRDVTMVRFPGESHGLTRGGGPGHRVERFEIVHEFFAKHLGGADFGTDHLGG